MCMLHVRHGASSYVLFFLEACASFPLLVKRKEMCAQGIKCTIKKDKSTDTYLVVHRILRIYSIVFSHKKILYLRLGAFFFRKYCRRNQTDWGSCMHMTWNALVFFFSHVGNEINAFSLCAGKLTSLTASLTYDNIALLQLLNVIYLSIIFGFLSWNKEVSLQLMSL